MRIENVGDVGFEAPRGGNGKSLGKRQIFPLFFSDNNEGKFQ
jgi:hypothetical protein